MRGNWIPTVALAALALWPASAGAFTWECPFGVNAHQAPDDVNRFQVDQHGAFLKWAKGL